MTNKIAYLPVSSLRLALISALKKSANEVCRALPRGDAERIAACVAAGLDIAQRHASYARENRIEQAGYLTGLWDMLSHLASILPGELRQHLQECVANACAYMKAETHSYLAGQEQAMAELTANGARLAKLYAEKPELVNFGRDLLVRQT